MQVRTKNQLLDDVYVQEVDLSEVEVIKPVNKKLFGEDRIINDFNKKDLIILAAYTEDVITGFKIGYGIGGTTFYSAKSGVLTGYRRNGIATKLLYRMILEVKKRGYKNLVYDTFPSRFPGMMDLGLKEGFKSISEKWNEAYKDTQIRMKLKL
ncbi:MAG: GNAT family N-acetyltransferase [Balneolales bacterium]